MAMQLTLTWDEEKKLKDGKRRFSDADGHNLYLTGKEVERLGKPAKLTLIIEGE